MLEQTKNDEMRASESSTMKRRVRVICALVIVLIIAFAALVMFLPKWLGGQKVGHRPMLLQQDDVVFMINGYRKVRLGSVDEFTQDGIFKVRTIAARKNGDVYYLKNYDKSKGTGDLIAVRPGGSMLVANDVYAAAAGCGGRALFVQNVENGAGELYLAEPGKLVVLVAKSVVPDIFGFSPNGTRYYYTVRKGDMFSLCEGSLGSKANLVFEDDAAEFRYAFCNLADDGQMLFSLGTDAMKAQLMHYKDGEFEQMGEGIYPVAMFDRPDDFLFMRVEDCKSGTTTSSVFYKAPGEDPVCVSESVKGLALDDFLEPDKQFVFTEGEGQAMGERGVQATSTSSVSAKAQSTMSSFAAEQPNDTLYMYDAGYGKTMIGEIQAESSCTVSSEGKGVAVIQGDPSKGSLYLSRKTDDGYSTLEKIDDAVIQYEFDDSADYLYWTDSDFVLKRCDVKTGQVEMLMDKVMRFWVIEDTLYACEDGMSIYRWCGDKSVKLHGHANNVTQTSGGVYVTTLDNELVFYAYDCDEGKMMCTDIQQLDYTRLRIRYSQLTQDTEKVLRALYEDALFYVRMDESTETSEVTIEKPHGTAQEDLALVLSLVRGTYPQDADSLVHYFCEGFASLAKWEQDKTDEELQRQAISDLSMAVSSYQRWAETR